VVLRGLHDLERRRSRGQPCVWLVGTSSTGRPLHRQRRRRRDTAAAGRVAGREGPLSHPRHELDDLLGHPVRFSIVAMLAAASMAEFGFVRDQVEVSDSMLSKQMTALEQAGYVKVRKGFIGRRGRTWLSLTAEGRRTFERHLSALRSIAGVEARRDATEVENSPATSV